MSCRLHALSWLATKVIRGAVLMLPGVIVAAPAAPIPDRDQQSVGGGEALAARWNKRKGITNLVTICRGHHRGRTRAAGG